MKTYMAKAEDVQRKWFVIDAQNKTLGRLTTQIAMILMGKNKPIYTPHADTGDFVIVVNAEKVAFTGKKLVQKMYRHHTGYPGGLKEVAYKDLMVKHPTFAVELAVKGMLPKNSLGRQMYTKLKVYAGPEHNNQAQQPEILDI